MWPALCGGPDDAHLGDRLALCEFVGCHRSPARALQRHAQPSLDPHRAQCRHEVAIGLQFLDRLVRRLAEVSGARDHHRHGHIDAGDRVAGDVIHWPAGRQQASGLGAHRVGEEQVHAGKRTVHTRYFGGDEPAVGADTHARARGHAGVGVEDVDLERVAGTDRLPPARYPMPRAAVRRSCCRSSRSSRSPPCRPQAARRC